MHMLPDALRLPAGVRPENLRFAVIGAGPSGLHAADRLVHAIAGARVDVFEKDPTPMGLVRYGIAPDHPAAARDQAALDRILDEPRIRLFTGVTVWVGRGASSHADEQGDLTLSELRAAYTAVIIATGALRSRPLAIAGTSAVNFHDSSDFTAWYNSVPGADGNWDLTTPIVAVIGGGNVALDVARMLLQSPDDLKKTAVAPNVIRDYLHSAVTEVHVFVRRGPAQVKWSAQQLRDLENLHDVTLNFDSRDFQQCKDELAESGTPLDREQRAIVRVMERLHRKAQDATQIDPSLPTDPVASAKAVSPQDRQVYFHFYSEPLEMPTDEDGEVTGLLTRHVHLDGQGRPVPAGDGQDGSQRLWHLSAVYSAIGYEIRGLGSLPRDPRTGALRNEDGRIASADGTPLAGLYATGWAKRGPRGLVADTLSDARELERVILSDLAKGALKAADPGFDPATVLRSRGVRFGGISGWHRIEQAERELGSRDGRAAAKIADASRLAEISRS